MTTVRVNIHSSDGIRTEIVGRGAGKLFAERNPRIGTRGGMGYGGIETDASDNKVRELITQALQESYVADMLTHRVSVKLDSQGAVGWSK